MPHLGYRPHSHDERPAVGMRDPTKNLAKKIAMIAGTAKDCGHDWAIPLFEAMSAGQLVFGGISEPRDPWPALEQSRIPAVFIVDDTVARGPEFFQALKRGRFWLVAAYVAVDTPPDGAKVIELARTHRRLIVILTTAAQGEAWATWLKTRCPARKHATLRAPGGFYDEHGLAE